MSLLWLLGVVALVAIAAWLFEWQLRRVTISVDLSRAQKYTYTESSRSVTVNELPKAMADCPRTVIVVKLPLIGKEALYLVSVGKDSWTSTFDLTFATVAEYRRKYAVADQYSSLSTDNTKDT